MSWDSILFDEVSRGEDLSSHIDALFAHQRENWTALRDGLATLAQIKTTELEEDGARVLVQSNPGRRKSTHAKVDAKSIAHRPCFLCPENMPDQERGIAFGDLVVLPNPYPVLSRHCTIPSRTHKPQQLAVRIGMMLELARAVGPDMLVYYNGPRCGASGTDHFHFQACCAAGVPILKETRVFKVSPAWHAHRSFGRRVLVQVDQDIDIVRKRIEQVLDVLRRVTAVADLAPEDEPMVNVIAHYRADRFATVMFPRAAHRPACYSAEGSAQIAVSPATLEMAGVLVVAEPSQFPRVDAPAARKIYKDVSLDEATFERVVKEITQ